MADKKDSKNSQQAKGAPARPPSRQTPAISDKGRTVIFAVLALAAVSLAAYALFFSQPADSQADGSEFYSRLVAAGRAGFLYDVRGADPQQASAIYQCGVDIIGRGRFAGKELDNIGCSEEGCIASSTDMNGTSRISFDEAKRQLSSMPYILIKPGEPAYKFFQRHMEISIGSAGAGNITCDISATEG